LYDYKNVSHCVEKSCVFGRVYEDIKRDGSGSIEGVEGKRTLGGQVASHLGSIGFEISNIKRTGESADVQLVLIDVIHLHGSRAHGRGDGNLGDWE
jgi:hypothetical protein